MVRSDERILSLMARKDVLIDILQPLNPHSCNIAHVTKI